MVRSGYPDEAASNRTVDTLMGGGSNPSITTKPEGASIHDVIDEPQAV